MKKIICAFIIGFFLLNITNSYASEVYSGYTYNSWGNSVPSPNAYEPAGIIDGKSIGTTAMTAPADMMCKNGKTYILDSGNSRVLVLDANYHLIREIKTFHLAEGGDTALSNPGSIYVSENNDVIIADTDSKRVLVSDENGNIKRVLTRPDSDIFPESIEYKPKKVVADKQNNIYVLCTGFYYGAIVYDESGRFTGFYGANRVEVSLTQLSDMFWRKFMTATQKSYISKYVPIDYTSFDVDDENFIYTCSRSTTSFNEIKKLNSLGSNILQGEITYDPLNKSDYGDMEKIWYNGNYIDTSFIDIEVSDDGLINALDFTYGRIFQYDQDSNLLTVFGGSGNQEGLFKLPAAIESAGKNILVLDSEKASVTIFSPTEYGKLIQSATLLYGDGLYREAMSEWEAVLRQNSNSELAYRGIGRALLQQENYKEAMNYLKLGQDRASYSKAFGYYRTQVAKKYFPLIACILLFLALIFIFWDRIKKYFMKFRKETNKPSQFTNPFHVILHPVEGMDEVRTITGVPQLIVSLGILVFWFFVEIIARQGTGFIFNLNHLEDMNLWMIAAKTGGIFFLFILCSWAVGSLNEGEASLLKLINVTACAILPYAVAVLLHTVISNFIVYEEGPLFNWAVTFVLCYSALLLFWGIMSAHQYSTGKTFLSLFFTAASMLIVLFVMALLFSLLQQLYIFFMTVYNEIMFRI